MQSRGLKLHVVLTLLHLLLLLLGRVNTHGIGMWILGTAWGCLCCVKDLLALVGQLLSVMGL